MGFPRQSAKSSVTAATNGHPAVVFVAFPGNVVAGNLIVVIVGASTSATFPSISVFDNNGGGGGNTYTFELLEQSNSSASSALFWTVAGSSGACTVEVDVGSTTNVGTDIIIAEYTAAGTPNIDVSHGQHATTGTTIGTGNITTTVAHDLLVAFGYDQGHDAHPWSDTASFTKEQETSNTDGHSICLFDNFVTSTGTYSDTFSGTITSGDPLGAGIAAFSGINGASPPVVSCNSPAQGNVGVVYTHTFTASGGAPPYTWSITVGSLPPGLTLNTSTGVVSGTPTTAGVYTFTITATDTTPLSGNASCSIQINASVAAGGGIGIYIDKTRSAPVIAADPRGIIMVIHSMDPVSFDDKLTFAHTPDVVNYTAWKLKPIWDWALQISPPVDLSNAFGLNVQALSFDTMGACCGRAWLSIAAKPGTSVYQQLYVGVFEWSQVTPV